MNLESRFDIHSSITSMSSIHSSGLTKNHKPMMNDFQFILNGFPSHFKSILYNPTNQGHKLTRASQEYTYCTVMHTVHSTLTDSTCIILRTVTHHAVSAHIHYFMKKLNEEFIINCVPASMII